MRFQGCSIIGIGVDSRNYHDAKGRRGDKDFVVSPSMLKVFAECPARWIDGYSPPDSSAKAYGQLLDCLTLTPELFPSRYCVRPEHYPDDGTKPWAGNSKSCKAWLEAKREIGLEVVKIEEVQAAESAAGKLLADPILGKFIRESRKQVHVRGEWLFEPERCFFGTEIVIPGALAEMVHQLAGSTVPCECLIDLAPAQGSEFECSLGDLKSTRSAHPAAWDRYSTQRGYHLQAAFDLDCHNAVAGAAPRSQWAWLLSENFPPYQTARNVIESSDGDFGPCKLTIGRVLYQIHLIRYAWALKTGHWPNYDEHSGAVSGWSVSRASRLDISILEAALEGVQAPEIEEPFVSETPT